MSSFNSYQPFDGDPFSLPQDSANLPVTPEQRQRVQDYLIEARNQGRISSQELDMRLADALIARNRTELDRTYSDISTSTPIPPQPQNPYGYPQPNSGYTYQAPYPVPTNYGQGYRGESTGVGRLAHFSGLVSMFIGPAIVYSMTSKGTLANREAARAFNFQLTMMVGFVLAGVLEGVTGIGIVGGVIGLLWMIGTIVGGATVGTSNGKVVDKWTVLKVLNDGKPTESHQIEVPKKNS